MSKESKRKKTGWWLPAIILLILTAAGIRYVIPSEWWFSLFNRQRNSFQPINTGVSIQVSATNAESVPVDKASPSPGEGDRETETSNPSRPRRMW